MQRIFVSTPKYLRFTRSAIKLSAVLLLYLAFSSCDPMCLFFDYEETVQTLWFKIQDRKTQKIYNGDSIMVYQDNLELVSLYKGDYSEYFISMHFHDFDTIRSNNLVNQRLEREFYVNYKTNDFDTLSIVFQVGRRWVCDTYHYPLRYYKVTFNDSIYFDQEVDNSLPYIVFQK